MVVLDGDILLEKLLRLIIFIKSFITFRFNTKIPVHIATRRYSYFQVLVKIMEIIQYSKKYEDIKNESLFTLRELEFLKAGIPIGRMNINNLSDEKKVDFYSDFSQLKFVKVVSFKKSENK